MHIFLFGGTTEGRKIAEHIAEENRKRNAEGRTDFFETEVFVATDYGAVLLPEEKHISVHVGRLDSEEMAELFEDSRDVLRSSNSHEVVSEDDENKIKIGINTGADDGLDSEEILVIDATHPYAAVVTENIYKACKDAGVRCIRVNRPKGENKDAAKAGKLQNSHDISDRKEGDVELSDAADIGTDSSDFIYFDNVKNAVGWLNSTFEKNPELRKHILITTGSKEIQEYTVIPDFQEYCYVRALPATEVLEKCMELGFRRDRLILMQGPFGVDMNMAQLRYASAGYMVTKDSGEIGGFPEKCEAAIELGVKVLVIGRPLSLNIQEEERYIVMSLKDVLDELSARY